MIPETPSIYTPDCGRALGLAGGHRTGKTTLARALAQATGRPFVATSTSAVFAAHGLDPAEPLPFDKRLFIQNKVLDAAEATWLAVSAPFVTDRTPLDMAAYTLADIRGDTVVDADALLGYVERCFQLTHHVFAALVVVQPGIPLVFEPGKAALNRAYIEHLNWLVQGLCLQVPVPSLTLSRETIALEARLQTVLAHPPVQWWLKLDLV